MGINVLAKKPNGTIEAPGGLFAHRGPQPATVQLQRQQDGSKAPTWWIRWGVIEGDPTAYGGGQKYKSRADAEAAFARIEAKE